MEKRALFLTGISVFVIATSSSGQIYSDNIFGYINKAMPKGFCMVAVQLKNGAGNKVVDAFPTPPNNTFVYKFNPATGGYVTIDYVGGWEGDELDMTLLPGEGAFVYAPEAFTASFMGEVQLVSSVNIPSGFSVRSSVLPQTGTLDAFGFPCRDGDFIYQYDPASGGYIINNCAPGGGWEGDNGGTAPAINIAESFFISHSGPSTAWLRTFSVN